MDLPKLITIIQFCLLVVPDSRAAVTSGQGAEILIVVIIYRQRKEFEGSSAGETNRKSF